MKRLSGILLCILVLCPLAGTFTWLHFQKMVVREEVNSKLNSGLKNDDLVLLKFSNVEAKNLEWENSNEFEYMDQMFDVVQTKSTRDSVYYQCWMDSEETAILNKLEFFFEEIVDGEHKKKHKSLISFFKELYYNEIPVIDNQPFLIKRLNFCDVLVYYNSILLSPSGPPPDLI